jgi:hypothetical protein
MAPKHVLVPHYTHSLIVNAQPGFPTSAVSVRVEHVNRIVPATRGLAVVVKHPMKLIVNRLSRFPSNGCHDFWIASHARFSALVNTGKTKEKIAPSGISTSDTNRTALLILTMPSAVASYRERSRWRTRIVGSDSICTSWLASLESDWPTNTG